ncbi:hypothetical protein ACNJX9_39015 [Bradyrhizobium sp. DASA03076]|uniref:hypothetical protein n=1 Tax=Bradyrhizobium sp. BLXBL-03 TaxID=3395916 RepID=UPI003F71F800
MAKAPVTVCSFSAVSASLQQLSGGFGSVLAGAIIAQGADGELIHFDRIGYVVVTTTIVTLVMMYFVQKAVAERTGKRVVWGERTDLVS